MNCLIVDDEASIRKSMIMMGRWAEFGIDRIFEAENGLRALQVLLEQEIDIVITDMKMDTMDGVAFLKHLASMAHPPQVLVISGYSDYPFMHSAIYAGVVDYILKPVSVDRFNEGLQLAIHKYHRKYGAQERDGQNSVRLRREGSIHNAMSSELASYPAVREFIERHSRYRLFGFNILNFSNICKNAFNGIPDLLYYTVQCALEERFAGRFDLLVVRLLGGYMGMMIGIAAFGQAFEDGAVQILSDILTEISQEQGICFVLGMGNPAGGIDAIADELYRVNQSINAADLYADKRVYYNAEDETMRLNPLRDAYEQLRAKMLSGDVGGTIQVIMEQMKAIYQPGALTMQNLRTAFAEVNSVLNEQLAARNLIKAIPVEMDYRKFEELLMQNYSDLERFRQLLSEYLTPYCEILMCSHTNSLITQMCRYVDEHYAEKLNLNTLSEKFYISREYASRIFKREIDTTFINYLTDVRLKHVCHLLVHTDLSIATIADHTGFKESGYLIRVFRKKYGVTPKEYRENKGTK